MSKVRPNLIESEFTDPPTVPGYARLYPLVPQGPAVSEDAAYGAWLDAVCKALEG